MKKKPVVRRRPKTTGTPAAQLQTSAGWTITRLPLREAVPTARRRAGMGEAPGAALPEAMMKGDFEVLDVVEVTPAAGRRGGAGETELPLRATVQADASVLLVIRQASGAISFRRPAAIVRRAARRGAAAAMEVEFSVPVLAGDPQITRRGMWSKVSAILVKLVKKAADLVVDPIAELAVPWLARKLEERLWKRRHQGWLQVTQANLAAGTLTPGVPDFSGSERGLLFIHGTFSNAVSAFHELAQSPFFAALRAIYGENIFAFDHFTFSKTPEENVRELLADLPEGDFEFDVITHSRGGLVLRTLTESAASPGAEAARVKIGRVVLVASPNAGTPLVSPQHWEDKLAWFANLLELLPDHPFVTAADWLANALIWFADKVVGNAPGLAAMDVQGEIIAELQGAPSAPAGTLYYALAANFHPPQHWWSRLADMGVDALFGGANDLVVPTEGCWQTDADPAAWLPGEHIGCFGLGGNLAPDEPSAVTHVSFFRRPETADFILKALRGESLQLPAMGVQPLPTRRGARALPPSPVFAATAGRATAPAPMPALPPPVADLGMEGWNTEDDLFLTVITQAEHSEMEADDSVPLLLATYGSARVAVPFYVRGKNDNAGQRWQQIIAMHRFMVAYANGKEQTFALPDKSMVSTPTDAFLQAFGRVLFDTLFPNEVRRLYDAARFRHDNRRLNIIFTSMIPWVADFPWEFAFDFASETFLATADVRFVRNVLSSMPADQIRPRQLLRILVVSAQPAGSVPLSIEDERRYIAEAFKPLTLAGLVEVEVIPRATPKLLHEAVRERDRGEEFDIIHFIGHGEFDRATGTGYVLFEDEGGREQRLSASQLLDILRSRSIRIVFLNACETGRGADAEYNRGVAMALVRDGIPAVVANQYSVLDRAASLFSLHFYACLACGLRLGDAMRESRIAIRYSGVEPMDWGVPVLFARNPNARLCAPQKARKPLPFPLDTGPAPTVVATRAQPVTRSKAGARAKEKRELVPVRPLKIAVWDVANALPYRENLEATLAVMNAAQDQFEFRLERMTAPRSVWTPDASSSSDVAYLNAERVAPRMEEIRVKLGVDYLLCVTDLPLRDKDTTALYLWSCHASNAPFGGVIIFSIWNFDPPLQGPLFKAAFANTTVMALAGDLSKVTPRANEPKNTLGYFNLERDVAHITGKLRITADTRKRMLAKKRIMPAQLAALEKLLTLFQPAGTQP